MKRASRYRDFMGWKMPWYSALDSLDTLLAGRKANMMYIICYLRRGSQGLQTYWTTRRGVEAMDNSYRLLDLTVFGRQEKWEDSPAGWPQQCTFTRTKTGVSHYGSQNGPAGVPSLNGPAWRLGAQTT